MEKDLTIEELKEMGIMANAPLSAKDLKRAKEIITNLQNNTKMAIDDGYGPFFAAIYDENDKLIAQRPNSVVNDLCSLYHAEINTIEETCEKYETYDLAKHNLTMYITAEPCIMCIGAIMWAGIKRVCFSVPSVDVERIAGFDEGKQGDWFNEFKKRGIKVYGNICKDIGIEVLEKYVAQEGEIYVPAR